MYGLKNCGQVFDLRAERNTFAFGPVQVAEIDAALAKLHLSPSPGKSESVAPKPRGFNPWHPRNFADLPLVKRKVEALLHPDHPDVAANVAESNGFTHEFVQGFTAFRTAFHTPGERVTLSVDEVHCSKQLVECYYGAEYEADTEAISYRVGGQVSVLNAGISYRPPVVFKDDRGNHWLASGYPLHTAAHLLDEQYRLEYEVRRGSHRIACWFAIGADCDPRSLPLTPSDDRWALESAILHFPEPRMSDTELDGLRQVPPGTTARVREEVSRIERYLNDPRFADLPDSEIDQAAGVRQEFPGQEWRESLASRVRKARRIGDPAAGNAA